MQKYPFQAIVFNNEIERHEMPDGAGKSRELEFVVDLDSVRFPRNPCVVDYDHDTKEPIGSATLRVDQGRIVADGFFVSALEGDRAFAIGTTFSDVPYGISPTLDLGRAEIEEIPEGREGEANGRKYQGPVFIYRSAAVLGISVCPIPTDQQTRVSPLCALNVVKLSRIGARLIMSDELENVENPIPVDEDTVEKLSGDPAQGDATGVQDGAQTVRDPELQEFIDEFGLESGVAFFQRGLTIDEARMEDYHELKKLARLSSGEKGNARLASEAEEAEKKDESPPDVASLSADVRKSLSILNGLCVSIARLSKNKGAEDSPRANYRNVHKTQKKTFAESVADAVK